MLVAFDTETRLIGPGEMSPRIICASFAVDGEEPLLVGNDSDLLHDSIEWLLTDEDLRVVTHNGQFDYSVVCATFPDLVPKVYDLLESGRATDTLWREKLINLSDTGRLTNHPMPDGSSKRVNYALSDLCFRHLGEDISAAKDGEDVWRKNYSLLDGWPAEEYPPEAADYAKEDARITLDIYKEQDGLLRRYDHLSVATESFQLYKAFILKLMSSYGMMVDQDEIERLEAECLLVMNETKGALEDAGILRPSNTSGGPYKADEERAYDILAMEFGTDLPPEIEDWTPYTNLLKARGVRMKKGGKPGTKNDKVLQKYLKDLYFELGEIPEETASGKIKCDAEVLDDLAGKDPVMKELRDRQALSKLVGQVIPALRAGPIVYPAYDALKETGRTSSYDDGKKTEDGKKVRKWASINIQQIPGEIEGLDPRLSFRPRPGRAFIDVDASGLELASVGHVTYTLFGESVHRDRYNAGGDLHGYLGAQIALGTSDNPMASGFSQACREEGIISDPLAVAESFAALKNVDDEEVVEFFKHFRTLAKPVGLGFPGGLGPATMVELSRKQYDVVMTEEEARAYREMWRETYPEMPRFFDWINSQTDLRNSEAWETKYEYQTPLGLVRRGATFCAAANGAAMQSPGAEAAMLGAAMVSRACYDPGQESVLYGCRPVAFVHDQVLVETTENEDLWHEQVEETARLFREGMEAVLTSIKMRTDDAMLTRVWSKKAEPVRDDNGRFIPWEPK